MEQFIIGISPRFTTNEKTGYQFIQINMDYIKQITNRGAIPFILTPGHSLNQQLNMCDGILLIGGDDINPLYYGETNDQGLSRGISKIEDETDKEIIQYALKKGLPTMGICRGIQDFAAFLGGSLYQDLTTFQLTHPENEKKHYVEKQTTTELTKRLPDQFLVNSFHHQAVNNLPNGFITTFKNGDVIEAIEHISLPFFGVQWHPERYYTAESEIIFNYFWEKINVYRKNNPK